MGREVQSGCAGGLPEPAMTRAILLALKALMLASRAVGRLLPRRR